MTSAPNLKSYIDGYQAAIKDYSSVLAEWERRAIETNENDVSYVIQEIYSRIDDIESKINDLAERI